MRSRSCHGPPNRAATCRADTFEVVQTPSSPAVFRGGVFSNFAASTFRAAGFDGSVREYASVEHYFQACKATTAADHELVRRAASPRDAKRLGRQLRLRPDWESVKTQVMREALVAKFSPEPFRSRLLRTVGRTLIEESAHDLEWGARRTDQGWEGENALGRLLVEVREELEVARIVVEL